MKFEKSIIESRSLTKCHDLGNRRFGFAIVCQRGGKIRYELRRRVPMTFVSSPFFGAALVAHMGRLDEAKFWATKALSLLKATPAGALAVAEGTVVEDMLDSIGYCRQVDRDHFAEGMRKAGIPG